MRPLQEKFIIPHKEKIGISSDYTNLKDLSRSTSKHHFLLNKKWCLRGLRFLEDYLTDFDNFWCLKSPGRAPVIFQIFVKIHVEFETTPERIRAYSRFLVQKPVLSGHHSPLQSSISVTKIIPILSRMFWSVLTIVCSSFSPIKPCETVGGVGVVRSLWRCSWRSPLRNWNSHRPEFFDIQHFNLFNPPNVP